VRISDAFRDRAALATLLDPNARAFVEGSEADIKQAREEWHRHRFVGQVMSSNLPEIPRSSLVFRRFRIVENAEDGRLYRLRLDATEVAIETAVAFFLDANGTPVLLEPPPGPQTRAELEQQRAAREQRRNAPKPRPAWMR
jgi:hypothetical protein